MKVAASSLPAHDHNGVMRMKLAATGILLGLLAGAALAETNTFDDATPGTLPPQWRAGVTGSGSPRGTVEADGSAPSRPNVLKQSGKGPYPWCVRGDTSLTNGFVEVKFKAIAGKDDQAGGVVWRWKDGDNYYVARANALEDNVTIYHTIK